MGIKGPTGDTVNFLYALMFLGYFLILFWVYVTFIEIRMTILQGKDASGDISMGTGMVVCTVLSVICIIQPLLAMSQQAQAWVNLTNSFRTDARQRVSALLSPKCDCF